MQFAPQPALIARMTIGYVQVHPVYTKREHWIAPDARNIVYIVESVALGQGTAIAALSQFDGPALRHRVCVHRIRFRTCVLLQNAFRSPLPLGVCIDGSDVLEIRITLDTSEQLAETPR